MIIVASMVSSLSNCFLTLEMIEMDELPAFRKYSPGDATCRLYVKNLTRQVTEDVSSCLVLGERSCLKSCLLYGVINSV